LADLKEALDSRRLKTFKRCAIAYMAIFDLLMAVQDQRALEEVSG